MYSWAWAHPKHHWEYWWKEIYTEVLCAGPPNVWDLITNNPVVVCIMLSESSQERQFTVAYLTQMWAGLGTGAGGWKGNGDIGKGIFTGEENSVGPLKV